MKPYDGEVGFEDELMVPFSAGGADFFGPGCRLCVELFLLGAGGGTT